MIAYEMDEAFANNPLLREAQTIKKYRGLKAGLEQVFADKRVQLAMMNDLAPADSEAVWNGRPSMPMMVTGHLAVLKRLMGWSYRTMEEEVRANIGWRWVSGIYSEPVPGFRTMQNREALLTPVTVELIHTRVLRCAIDLKLTDGKQLRMDSSETDSDIHYPTDSSLLDDSARVLSRTFRRARKLVKPEGAEEQAWFRDRHRQAHSLAWKIAKQSHKIHTNSPKAYAQLLNIVAQLIEQAQHVKRHLAQLKTQAAHRLAAVLDHYLPRVHQVVWQAQQRIIHKISLPAESKLLSLFEPHTNIICRGKAKPKDTEFGHKVWYAEVEGGFISEVRVLTGNPSDDQFVIPAIKHHRRLFGHSPVECAGDRGLHSDDNERKAKDLGVKRVSLPKPGYKSKQRERYEHTPWFRAAQRFRNGIEGRISQLRRARHLDRCLNIGWYGFLRWVGWGVIANNIAILANHFATLVS
jgi:IS5 family transposase